MPACRSCGTWISWAITERGARMPIEEQAGGNLEISATSDQTGTHLVKVVEAGTGTHVSHFASCPQADQWRKP